MAVGRDGPDGAAFEKEQGLPRETAPSQRWVNSGVSTWPRSSMRPRERRTVVVSPPWKPPAYQKGSPSDSRPGRAGTERLRLLFEVRGNRVSESQCSVTNLRIAHPANYGR